VGWLLGWLLQRLIALLVVLVAFAMVNAVLFLTQEAWFRFHQAKVDAFDREMSARWGNFRATKASLDEIESRSNPMVLRIEQLRTELSAIADRYRTTGAPPEVYARYQLLRAEHNRLVSQIRPVAARRRALVAEFNAQVDAYNKDVEQLNALIKRVPTSRWYLVPLPGLGGSRASVKSPLRTLRPALAH
jgi:hypothetical protein